MILAKVRSSEEKKCFCKNIFLKNVNTSRVDMINPSPLGILARNLPESSKIHQCTFGNMPLSSKCTMHLSYSALMARLVILPNLKR